MDETVRERRQEERWKKERRKSESSDEIKGEKTEEGVVRKQGERKAELRGNRGEK